MGGDISSASPASGRPLAAMTGLRCVPSRARLSRWNNRIVAEIHVNAIMAMNAPRQPNTAQSASVAAGPIAAPAIPAKLWNENAKPRFRDDTRFDRNA